MSNPRRIFWSLVLVLPNQTMKKTEEIIVAVRARNLEEAEEQTINQVKGACVVTYIAPVEEWEEF